MYPKLFHGSRLNYDTILALDAGWATEWRSIGVDVVGWGWLEGSPEDCADLAVGICRSFGLDGFIGNAEDAYEGDGAWRSRPFVERFRRNAPLGPLGLSYIGDGYPYRNLDFKPWVEAGAALLPQCYWGGTATSVDTALWALERLAKDLRTDLRSQIFPTLGTSGFSTPYPAEFYRVELDNLRQPYNVWLLESTSDDYLRALAP